MNPLSTICVLSEMSEQQRVVFEQSSSNTTQISGSSSHRLFYDFRFVDEALSQLINSKDGGVTKDFSQLVTYIRANLIGSDFTFLGPYGLRKSKL